MNSQTPPASNEPASTVPVHAICSLAAVPLEHLPGCCIEAAKKGQNVITYLCDGCKTLRQFLVDRPKEYRRQEVVCECGHQQSLYLFKA